MGVSGCTLNPTEFGALHRCPLGARSQCTAEPIWEPVSCTLSALDLRLVSSQRKIEVDEICSAMWEVWWHKPVYFSHTKQTQCEKSPLPPGCEAASNSQRPCGIMLVRLLMTQSGTVKTFAGRYFAAIICMVCVLCILLLEVLMCIGMFGNCWQVSVCVCVCVCVCVPVLQCEA